ncbi:MAG TPA: DoxX family protein [Chitinophagaceae bacterium]|nr:DoxX family protein [Chitinophagaceae bacterium]
MKQLIFYSDNSWAGFILRLIIGVVMLPHGAQKLLGSFGGYGFRSTMSYFTDTMKLPSMIAMMIIFIEFFGSLAFILGVSSRLWALLFIIIMAGAIVTTNYKFGFFMNWFGSQKGEGFEYHLLVIGICMGLLFTGSGKYSLDRLLNTGW